MVEKEVIGESAYSYERIRDPKLRTFFERSVEPAIQRVIEWPIQTGIIPVVFSAAFRLDRNELFSIIRAVVRHGVISLVKKQEGKGNGFRYVLDQDGVRVIGALSWEFAERRGRKNTLLSERIGRVAEALGDHPLREKLNPSLLPPKSSTYSLPPSQSNEEEDGVPIDEEEIVIKRLPLGSVPYIDEQELEAGRFWTLKELGELLPYIPGGWEEISYARIPQLFGGHPYNYAITLQIMFSGAAYATDPRELRLFSPLLKDLNYNELRLGIRRCIVMLERRPDIKDLTELFQHSVMRVQRGQQTVR